MSTNFQIDFKKSKSYLHIIPRGDLDGSSAWELVNLLDEQYDGKGRVVIDTQNLREMCPFGCSTFRCRLKLSRLPSNRLSFRGEKGYEIAPEGSKVVVSHKKHGCRCNGRCHFKRLAEESTMAGFGEQVGINDEETSGPHGEFCIAPGAGG